MVKGRPSISLHTLGSSNSYKYENLVMAGWFVLSISASNLFQKDSHRSDDIMCYFDTYFDINVFGQFYTTQASLLFQPCISQNKALLRVVLAVEFSPFHVSHSQISPQHLGHTDLNAIFRRLSRQNRLRYLLPMFTHL